MSGFRQLATAKGRGPMRRLCVTLLVWVSVGAGVTVVRAAEELDDAYVKAAFIYNFAKFTQWPDAKAGRLTVGVIGRTSINGVLRTIINGKAVTGRELVVRETSAKADDLRAFHIIFVPVSEASRVAAIVERVAGAAVLTVGDSEHFLQDGGIVQFYIRENHVRFQIDADAASQAGLKISSQLLSLAKQ